MNKTFFIQIFKYGIAGVINTLLSAFVIWVMLRWVFEVKDDRDATSMVMFVSNICGYTVGLMNSFIINRNWTFKSKSNWRKGFLKFLLAFGICYLIQLGVVLVLNRYASISPVRYTLFNEEHVITPAYVCQLIGIVSYTGLNFFFNKYYTFKVKGV